jgi:hypothetical protein
VSSSLERGAFEKPTCSGWEQLASGETSRNESSFYEKLRYAVICLRADAVSAYVHAGQLVGRKPRAAETAPNSCTVTLYRQACGSCGASSVSTHLGICTRVTKDCGSLGFYRGAAKSHCILAGYEGKSMELHSRREMRQCAVPMYKISGTSVQQSV